MARARKWVVAAVAVVLIAGGGGYYAYRQGAADPAAPANGPLDADDLAARAQARGLSAGGLVQLLVADAAVERFAEQAAGERTSAADKARAVVDALRKRAAAQAFVPWSLSEARPGAPRTAAETLAAIGKDGARLQLYPLEVAALGVAALRALDVPAMLAEAFPAAGERAPLDPSGRLGYFAIALPGEKGAAASVFDPYGGRAQLGEHTLLQDPEALGAALSLRALGRLEANEDPAAALRDSDAAVALLPTSPTVRSARGTALLLSAASEQGRAELQAAAQMRPDGPRRNNLAMIELAMGDAERATRELSQALEREPDFALGHVTLAAVHLARGERDQARAELDKAQALDPGLPSLLLSYAELHASGGQLEQAIGEAQRAVDARPGNPQARLLLARIYREAGRYDAMREQARKVLALAPAALQERTRELLKRLLGPSALDQDPAPSADSAEPALPGVASPSDPLKLDAPGAGRPTAPGPGTLQGSPAEPKLRLTEPGARLKLEQ
ncbi:MAG TPA: tetratricopeptide repeat protein [Polyangiales bacterium]|nr:tetratricopeptide repeat protein [Polyangiales bacterium]